VSGKDEEKVGKESQCDWVGKKGVALLVVLLVMLALAAAAARSFG
jgi:hypothetical protein